MYRQKTVRTIILMLLIVSLLSTMISFAEPKRESEFCTIKEIGRNGYEIVLQETINADNSTTRTFSKTKNDMINEAFIEDMLFSLGLDEEDVIIIKSIDTFDMEKIDRFSITISYVKINEKTGEREYLTKKDALSEVASAKCKNQINRSSNPYEDTYMRVVVWSIYDGLYTYNFGARATWLIMPYFRQNDSVGVSSNGCALVVGSEVAGYYYTRKVVDGGNISIYNETFSAPNSSILNPTSGQFYGAAIQFDLPSDFYTSNLDYYECTDFNAYVYCNMQKRYPEQVDSFNIVGSYAHNKSMLIPTVSLDTTGGISLTPTWLILQENRNAIELIDYIP